LTLQYRDRLSDDLRTYAEVYAAFQDAANIAEAWRVLTAAADRFPGNSAILSLFQIRGVWAGPAYSGDLDWGPRTMNAWERSQRLRGGDSALHRGAWWGAGLGIWTGDLERAELYAGIAAHGPGPPGGTRAGGLFQLLLWHRLRGDTAGAAAVWASAEELCQRRGLFRWYWPPAGLPLDDWERCNEVRGRSVVTQQDRYGYLAVRLELALLRGEQSIAVAINDSMLTEDLYRYGGGQPAGNPPGAFGLIRPIRWWLVGPGYEAAARRAAAVLDSIQSLWPDSIIESWNDPWERTCYIALWQAVDGPVDEVTERIEWLESADLTRSLGQNTPDSPDRDCPSLLRVLLEARLNPGGDAPQLNRLDSLMPAVGVLMPTTVSTELINLAIARLRLTRGEWSEAFAAAQRRQPQRAGHDNTWPAFFWIEGRAAEELGLIEHAIHAYDLYLNLRTDPDPGPIRDEWEDARRRLTALLEREGNE
jgi:hypothetical protein